MNIDAILFDIDGVLTIENIPIDGAAEALTNIKSKGLRCRFITNTTTKPAEQIFSFLTGLKFPVERNEIFSAPEAAVRYLRKKENPKVLLVVNESLKSDFSEFQTDNDNPDYIIIGDIGDNWSNELMNRLFNLVLKGAQIIALHKGKFWQVETGLKIDIGAYVAGLEYVTGKPAIVTGKPSREFFQLIIDDLNIYPENIAVVGDDIETDIGAAQVLGMHGILVRTGKYREDFTKSLGIVPKLIIDSVRDLPGLTDVHLLKADNNRYMTTPAVSFSCRD